MKLCFFHKYKAVTPSFMHLFVAKDHTETPASVPMYAGRECCNCGKRHVIALQEKIPTLIEERAQQWQAGKLTEVAHDEQLLWFSNINKFILIKDLEHFLIEQFMQNPPQRMKRFLVIPMDIDETEERNQVAQSRRSEFKLVVNNKDAS